MVFRLDSRLAPGSRLRRSQCNVVRVDGGRSGPARPSFDCAKQRTTVERAICNDYDLADLDRAGTWLRRPPTDYEPTVFDKYWRPSETLLEEWVRKGYSVRMSNQSVKSHRSPSLITPSSIEIREI